MTTFFPVPMLKTLSGQLLRLCAAAGLIFLLVRGHSGEFAQVARKLHPGFFLSALALHAMQNAICARRWQRVMAMAGFRISWPEAFSLTMRGCFCSLFLPGGILGGDAAKIGFLAIRTGRGQRLDGAMTILLDRMIGMTALFLLSLLLIALNLPVLLKVEIPGIALTPSWRIAAVAVLTGLCLTGLLAVPVLLFHRELRRFPLPGRIFSRVEKWSGGALNRLFSLMDAVRGRWRMITCWTLLTVIFVHGANIAVLFCIIAGLGIADAAFLPAAAAVSLGNIAGMLPISIAGLGVRDTVICILLTAAGLPEPAVVPLLYSSIIILFNLTGGLFLIGNSAARSIARVGKP